MAIIYGICAGELPASERDQRRAVILNFSLRTADAMPLAVLMQKWLLRHD